MGVYLRGFNAGRFAAVWKTDLELSVSRILDDPHDLSLLAILKAFDRMLDRFAGREIDDSYGIRIKHPPQSCLADQPIEINRGIHGHMGHRQV